VPRCYLCEPPVAVVGLPQIFVTKMAAGITFDVLLDGLLNKDNNIRRQAESYYLNTATGTIEGVSQVRSPYSMQTQPSVKKLAQPAGCRLQSFSEAASLGKLRTGQ